MIVSIFDEIPARGKLSKTRSYDEFPVTVTSTLRCDSAISLEDNIMVRRHLLAAEDKTRF